MKGVSLPINVIVIIAIAVLVMLALVAFFMGGYGPSSARMTDAAAWQRGCADAQAAGCPTSYFEQNGYIIRGYNGDADPDDDDLLTACRNYYGDSDMEATECYFKCCGRTVTTIIS